MLPMQRAYSILLWPGWSKHDFQGLESGRMNANLCKVKRDVSENEIRSG